MDRAEDLRLRADLAEALQRRESLQYRWARAKYTSSGGSDTPEDIDVELARVEATIAELEARLALAGAAPAPAVRSAINLASPPVNDVQPAALPLPELLTTREAAAFLRLSTDTLERLRTRPGEGPPFKRVGRRVLYPVAGLRDYGSRK